MMGMLGRSPLLLLASLVLAAEASGAPLHRLSDWLRGLAIPIPAGASMSFMGIPITMRGGTCRNARVGAVSAIDDSNGTELELGIELHGLSVECDLDAYSEDDMNIKVSLVDSGFKLAVRALPYYPPGNPELPLPTGGLSLTTCELDIRTGYANFTGNSSIVDTVAMFDAATLNALIGMYVTAPMCSEIRQLVEVNSTSYLLIGSMVLADMMRPPRPISPPREILDATLDWGTWPPIMMVEDLIEERFPVWAGRMLQVLDATINRRVMETDFGVNLDLNTIVVHGQAPFEKPGLAILADGTSLGLAANLSSLRFTTSFTVEANLANQPEFSKQVEISFGLDSFNMQERVVVNKPVMKQMQKDGEFSEMACLVDAAEAATSPPRAAIAVSEMSMVMQDGTQIEVTHAPLDALEQNATALVNTILGALQAGYLPSLNALITGALAIGRDSMDRILWDQLHKQPACGSAHEGVDESTLTVLWGTCMCSFVLGCIVAVVAPFVWRRAPPPLDENGEIIMVMEGTTPRARSALPEPDYVALFREPNVPKWLAWFYPFALLSILMLFVYADLAIGAEVNVQMTAHGESEVMGPVFAFSLLNTVQHSWTAGAWLISILTLIMSGIWPMFKLTMLFVIWVVPARHFGKNRRGKILGFMDVAGKYSFLDSWFLVLSMSAFALEWNGKHSQLKVETLPTAGFYAFFAATCLSLCLGHVASELHRWGMKHPDPRAPGRMATMPMRVVSLSMFVPRWKRWGLTLTMLTTLFVSAMACFLTSFEYIMGGLTSTVLAVEPQKFSLLSVGLKVPDAAGVGSAGLYGLEVVFLLLVVVLPLVLIVIHTLLWVVPLQRRTQDILIQVAHMMDCWASMDVAALTLVIEAMQLSYLTEFLVQSEKLATPCRWVKDITEEECFEVFIKLHPGFWFMVAAGILMLVVPKVMHRTSLKAIQERDISGFDMRREMSEKAGADNAIVDEKAPAKEEAEVKDGKASLANVIAAREPAKDAATTIATATATEVLRVTV